MAVYTAVSTAVLRQSTRIPEPTWIRVVGRLTPVYTAVYMAVLRPSTRLSTWPSHGRLTAVCTAVLRPSTRIQMGPAPSSRLSYGRVHGRLYGRLTAVYTALYTAVLRPCTRIQAGSQTACATLQNVRNEQLGRGNWVTQGRLAAFRTTVVLTT